MLMTGKSKDIIRSTLKCQLKADSLFQETAFFFFRLLLSFLDFNFFLYNTFLTLHFQKFS